MIPRTSRPLFALLVLLVSAGCGGGADTPREPAYAAELERADNAWSRGDVDLAAKQLVSLLERDTKAFPARYRLGVLRLEEDPREALRDLEAAAALRPDHPGPVVFTGLVKLDLNDFGGGDRALSRGFALAETRCGYSLPDTTEAVRDALHALQGGRPAEASRLFSRALAEDLDDPVLWYLYVLSGLEAGSTVPLEELDQPGARTRFPEADVLRARILLQHQRRTEAEAILDDVLAAHPDLAVAHAVRGHLALKDSRLRDAMFAFWEAVLADPSVPDYHHQLGQACLAASLHSLGARYLGHASLLKNFVNRYQGNPDAIRLH